MQELTIFLAEVDEKDGLTGIQAVDVLDANQLSNVIYNTQNSVVEKAVETRLNYLNKIESAKMTLELLKRKKIVIAESAFITRDTDTITKEADTENIVDIVGDMPDNIRIEKSADLSTGQKELLSIDKFFSRPIQIAAVEWTLNQAFTNNYKVWDLYTKHPAVRAKLKNYSYLRADMKIKIVVTGNPFQYARLLVSYQPYAAVNEVLTSIEASYVVSTTFRGMYLSYLSQAKGARVINVLDNKPLFLDIPYIAPKPMGRLYNSATTALTAATSYSDFAEMGRLYLWSLNNLLATNDSTNNASIYIYASLENVELGAPTATVIEVTTESSFDERKTGPVEKIASNMKNAVAKFRDTPGISSYAMASHMTLQGMEDLAAILGWSRPTQDSKVGYVKNIPFNSGALAIAHDSALSLGIDPKRQLTVDPSSCGTDQDDLIITNITKIRTYLTKFHWFVTDVPLTPIFTMAINPMLCTTNSYNAVNYIQPSAMAYAGGIFKYWRGDINVRLEIVVSAFHRGKFAICYEPNLNQNVLINSALSINKQFIKIVDIQETQCVEFTIKWASDRPWRFMEDQLSYTYLSTMYGYGVTLPTNNDTYNGYISVYPITRLVAPTYPDVEINVYVSSDNMHFAFPEQQITPTKRAIAQSNFSLSELQGEVTTIPLNDSTASDEKIAVDYFGEEVLSYRSLLKRYHLYQNQGSTTQASTSNYVSAQFNNIALPPVIYAAPAVAGTITHVLDYLRFAFLGLKGSVRYRARVTGQLSTDMWTNFLIQNYIPSNYSANSISVGTGANYLASSGALSTMNGAVAYIPHNNAGFDYELPFYTNNSWVFSFRGDLGAASAFADAGVFQEQWVRRHRIIFTTSNNATGFTIILEMAVGEDFNLMRFNGAPYYSL